MKINYKKIRSFIFILGLLTQGIKAQLSGVYAVPATYTSIAAVLSDLNTLGVSGAVTVNIAAGYTETAPIGGYILNAVVGTSSVNTIIFQKSGASANPLITANTGTATPASAVQDGVWSFVGSDFITINGIDITDPNTTNPATMEFGYGFFKASVIDGCQSNTIQNCNITLNRANNAAGSGASLAGSRGINMVNALIGAQTAAITVTATTGSNSNNRFYSNTIQNCNIGIAVIGFADSSPFANADTGNDLGGSSAATGNNVLNFGGGGSTSAAAGIQTLAQYGINISYNTVNSNNGSGVNHLAALTGILNNTAVSANATISNNTVTVRGGGTTQALIGIQNVAGATAANNAINITNNLVTGCTYTTATSGVFTGIVNSASTATLNITNNTISNNSTNAASGTQLLISNSGAVTSAININNNNLNGFTYNSTAAGTFNQISNSGGSGTALLTISSNSIQGTTHALTSSTTHNFIINTASTLNQTITNNAFINQVLNTTGSVTFMSDNVSLSAAGIQAINGNSIVTGFNKTGAGGTVMFFNTNASSSSGAVSNAQNNNFSNITLTGGTTMNGWTNTDGGSPTKSITANVFNNWNCGTSAVTCINVNFSGDNTSIASNTVSNIGGAGAVTGILFSSSNGGINDFISSNIISTLTSSVTGGAVTGINASGPSVSNLNINGNTVNSLSSVGPSAVVGIQSSATQTVNIYKNKIYDISGSNSGSTVNGVQVSGGVLGKVYNNIIGDLRATIAVAANAIIGINITGGTTSNVYFNSVNMNATSTGTLFGTSALFASTGTGLDLRNNILVNTSTPVGGAVTTAYRRSSTTLASYSATSNNNLYYTGVPSSTSNPVFYDGTNALTLNLFKGLVSGPDLLSVTENPPFLSVVGLSANFLNINTAVSTQIESGALPVSGITDDYSSAIRNVTTPDIGAREGTYLPRLACVGAPATNSALSSVSIVCSGGGAGLSIANSYTTSGITYQWLASTTGSNGAYTAVSNATTVALSAINLTTTTWYSANIICSNGPATSSAIAVQVAVPPSVSITPASATVCALSPVSFTASGAASYTWINTNLAAASTTFIPASNAIYTVTGTNLPNCITTATVAVTTLSLPVVVVSPSYTTVCAFASQTFTASGANTYTWNNNSAQTGSTVAISSPSLSLYTVSGKGPNGCTSTNNQFIVNTNPAPPITITASSPTVCSLAPVYLIGGGALTYTWSNNTNGDSTIVYPLNGNTVFSVSASDPVTGCIGTQTISVFTNTLPIVTISPASPTVCAKTQLTLTAIGNDTYAWSNGVNGTRITVTPSVNVSYTLTATNALGCSNTQTVTIVTNPLPSIVVSPPTATICASETASFSASGAINYTWTPGNINTSTISITPAVTGFYVVTGSDNNNCVNKTTITLVVSACTGIKTNAAANSGVSLFPNPSNGMFTAAFDFEGSKTIMITNSVGQVVQQMVTTNSTEHFDLSSMAKGIYFVIVSSQQASGNYKIIVQ